MRTGEEMDLHVYMSKRKSLKRCTCTYKLTHVHVYLQTIPFTSNYNKGMIIITEYTLMNCTKNIISLSLCYSITKIKSF